MAVYELYRLGRQEMNRLLLALFAESGDSRPEREIVKDDVFAGPCDELWQMAAAGTNPEIILKEAGRLARERFEAVNPIQ